MYTYFYIKQHLHTSYLRTLRQLHAIVKEIRCKVFVIIFGQSGFNVQQLVSEARSQVDDKVHEIVSERTGFILI